MAKRIGWRVWSLTHDEQGPVLRSPEFGVQKTLPLNFGERESWAVCLEKGHAPPKKSCRCGLYSAESIEAALCWLPPELAGVAGKVELLGKVHQGTPEIYNQVAHDLMPFIGLMTGRHTSPEYRSAGVRLVGKQRVHPDHAEAIPALEARYGVPFRVDRRLEGVDIGQDLDRAERALRRTAMALLGSEGSAGLVVFNQERTHLVLQLRSALVDHGGTWALPGGLMEPGETPTEAALREAREERCLPRTGVELGWEVPYKGYTYVSATAEWSPEDDPVLPFSANSEAEGAAWMPVDLLDRPDLYPNIRLHPKLRKAWPKVRDQLWD